mmetsp:Transcript_13934/g.19950  ORF Transcript_13934/g.19950 Transcript_13934/m.19950 type:complete len:261 (+) Transcript_13934:100-882(+)
MTSKKKVNRSCIIKTSETSEESGASQTETESKSFMRILRLDAESARKRKEKREYVSRVALSRFSTVIIVPLKGTQTVSSSASNDADSPIASISDDPHEKKNAPGGNTPADEESLSLNDPQEETDFFVNTAREPLSGIIADSSSASQCILSKALSETKISDTSRTAMDKNDTITEMRLRRSYSNDDEKLLKCQERRYARALSMPLASVLKRPSSSSLPLQATGSIKFHHSVEVVNIPRAKDYSRSTREKLWSPQAKKVQRW